MKTLLTTLLLSASILTSSMAITATPVVAQEQQEELTPHQQALVCVLSLTIIEVHHPDFPQGSFSHIINFFVDNFGITREEMGQVYGIAFAPKDDGDLFAAVLIGGICVEAYNTMVAS